MSGQVINTNIMSLNAQRNLGTSRSDLASALQRLSTGLRINSAKDDAAGLAISERFSTQIRGLNQAVRNANDGISLSQTAEGALQEVTNNLQRIRELAVQSANATNSASDRAALDQEVQQRLLEIERIASQTSFNGQKILDGSFGSAQFQVGANVGDVINVALSNSARSTTLGQIAQTTSTAEVTVANVSGTGTIQVGSGAAKTIGLAVAGSAVGQTVGSAWAKAAAINAASVPGLSVSATNNVEFGIAATAGATGTYSLTINGTVIYGGHDVAVSGGLSTQQITDAINAQTSNTGVTATLTGANLRLTAADGRDIAIGQDLATITGGISAGSGGNSTVNGVVFRDGQLGTVAQATANSATAAAVNGGTLTFTASENIVITGDGTVLGLASANLTVSRDTTTLASQNVLTVSAANQMLSRVDSALTDVSELRSTFGAIQNRFESTIANLQTVSENLTASRSRIRDADFAAETAQLTRAQILQQAGVSILAQANAVPQQVLGLLRGG